MPFANARTCRFADQPGLSWEARLTLEEATRTLRWNVSENNHAVEYAWAHPMGRALARALASVTWTRGSGGTFIGNDEYNRDSECEDGGANYVTRGYGPLGEV
jgi:hypothetical protein